MDYDNVWWFINSCLVVACIQNLYCHYNNIYTFISSPACVDTNIREAGGPLLNYHCYNAREEFKYTSVQNLMVTSLYVNYTLIIVLMLSTAVQKIISIIRQFGVIIPHGNLPPPRYPQKPDVLRGWERLPDGQSS